MLLELQCRNCKKSITVAFKRDVLQISKCPFCGTEICRYDREVIQSVYDKVQSFNERSYGFIMSCLYNQKVDNLVQQDIREIQAMLASANNDNQMKIQNMIDTLVLCICDEIKDNKETKNLDRINVFLKEMFNEKVNSENEKIYNRLGFDLADKSDF